MIHILYLWLDADFKMHGGQLLLPVAKMDGRRMACLVIGVAPVTFKMGGKLGFYGRPVIFHHNSLINLQAQG